MFQRVVFGKVTRPENENLKDLSARERLVLSPLILLIFWIGVYPKPFLDRVEPAAKQVLIHVSMANAVHLNEDYELVERPTYGSTQEIEAAGFSEEGAIR